MLKLIRNTLITIVIGTLFLGLLLFLPAQTLAYWQAWVFIAVFLVSVSVIGVYLSLKDPALLARRKAWGPANEQNPVQRVIMSLATVVLLGLPVLCALDHRFGWSHVPVWVSLLGDLLVAFGLFINLLVFRQNTYGASNVRVEQGQQVISSGLYAVIRHPMYAGVLIMVIGVPLALGSLWGLLILPVAVPGLAWRILDEEKLLQRDLPGYAEYMQRVRWRLLPGIW